MGMTRQNGGVAGFDGSGLEDHHGQRSVDPDPDLGQGSGHTRAKSLFRQASWNARGDTPATRLVGRANHVFVKLESGGYDMVPLPRLPSEVTF